VLPSLVAQNFARPVSFPQETAILALAGFDLNGLTPGLSELCWVGSSFDGSD
jgi:hypothetical protein